MIPESPVTVIVWRGALIRTNTARSSAGGRSRNHASKCLADVDREWQLVLAALASDLQQSVRPVDVVEPQAGDFTSAQAKSHQENDERPVPCPDGRSRIADAQQGCDLVGVHATRQGSSRSSGLEDPGAQVTVKAAGVQRPSQ